MRAGDRRDSSEQRASRPLVCRAASARLWWVSLLACGVVTGFSAGSPSAGAPGPELPLDSHSLTQSGAESSSTRRTCSKTVVQVSGAGLAEGVEDGRTDWTGAMPIALTATAVRIEFRTAVGGSPSPARDLAHDEVSPLVEGPAPQALAAPSSANRWPLERGARRAAARRALAAALVAPRTRGSPPGVVASGGGDRGGTLGRGARAAAPGLVHRPGTRHRAHPPVVPR